MNVKKLAMALFVMLFVICISHEVGAAYVDTFTTTDGIVATKIVENSDGTIDFKLSNIELSSEGQYTWSVAKTSVASEAEKWYTLGDFSEANKTAVLSLTPSINTIKEILKTTNTAWLYVKDVKNDVYIVDALKVDLTLPALKAFTITKSAWYDPDVPSNSAWEISRTYNLSNFYYKVEKITDTTIIEQYAANNGDLTKMELADLSEAPETGWKTCVYTDSIPNSAIPTETGLYYLWVKAKDTDSKVIIGYTVIDFDDLGPTVRSIDVTSPPAGTYGTSQTVKIRVYFDEEITGTSVPTLTIKFGNSPDRALTNGTIKGRYIEYSYNIQADDVGQLATVSLVGGTIKDASGNDAKITCPLISGNAIKANTEGTVTNNTENKDQTNNTDGGNNNSGSGNNGGSQTPAGTNNNANPGTVKPSTTQNNNSSTTTQNNSDKTTATTVLPNTGAQIGIIVAIAVVSVFGIVVFIRYKKFEF